jgi:hypothetical protein
VARAGKGGGAPGTEEYGKEDLGVVKGPTDGPIRHPHKGMKKLGVPLCTGARQQRAKNIGRTIKAEKKSGQKSRRDRTRKLGGRRRGNRLGKKREEKCAVGAGTGKAEAQTQCATSDTEDV